MRKIRGLASIGVLTVWMWLGSPLLPAVVAQDTVEAISPVEREVIVAHTVEPFMRALQEGNVEVLAQHIDGHLAQTLGKLLRQNQAYPDYLRRRYGGTSIGEAIQVFHPKSLTGTSDNEKELRMAVVHLTRPEGAQENFQLSLAKNTEGQWKVIDKKAIR